MRAINNWALACALALAVSALPASAQSTGSGQSGQSGAGQSGAGGQTGMGGQTGTAAGGDQGTTVGQSGSQQVGQNSRGDLEKFVQKAAINNMAEIQLGQLAQQKAQDPDVKQFAQEMVDQHTKAQNELQQAASTQGLSLPSSLDSKHQKIQDKLSNLSGSDFDREYMKVMVKSHKDTAKLLEKRAGKQNASASYGASGTAGTSGTSGTTGTSGTAGESGTSGASGTGTSGASGTSGAAGTSGTAPSGSSATTGTTAESGTAGSAGTSGANADIRDVDSWAAATLPAVQHHLQMAQDLEKRLKDQGKSSNANDKDRDKDKVSK